MARVLQIYNVFGARTERVWLEYPAALARRGFVTTYAYESLAIDDPPVVDGALVLVQRINVAAAADVPGQMREIAERPGEGIRQLLQGKFDLIHGHSGPRVLQGAAWLARGTPMVVSLYGYDASRLLRDADWIERYKWGAGHGAMFIALGEAMRDDLVGRGLPTDRVRVIRLGLELEHWPFAPAAAPAEPRFVFAGRLVEKKGVADLLAAFAMVRAKYPSATLRIVGAGPLEQALRKLAGEGVMFLGAGPRETVREELLAATALVLPSVTAADGDSEGTPIILMEAGALGVPCITTRHGGNAEVVGPQAEHLVVPERDSPSLARAMMLLIEQPPEERRRLQLALRQWIEQRYDLRQTIDAYERLYRELIGEGRDDR